MDYSKIAQTLLKKLFNIWNDGIAAASDHAALGVSVIKCFIVLSSRGQLGFRPSARTNKGLLHTKRSKS